jgi:hypothetical protein
MKTTVKKWAFNLVLLSLIASCGGDDNSTGTGSNVVNDNSPITGDFSGTSQGARNENELINEIAAGNFSQESTQVYRAFYIKRNSSSGSGSSSFWDSFKDSFSFDFCWNGDCNNGMTNLSYRELDGNQFRSTVPFDNSSGSLGGLKQKLIALVQSGSRIYKCGNYFGNFGNFGCADLDNIRNNSTNNNSSFVLDDRSKVFVVEKNNTQYMIDLSMPLIANPVSILNLNSGGERYDFYNAYRR